MKFPAPKEIRDKSVQLSSEIVAMKKYLAKSAESEEEIISIKGKLTCWSLC